MISCVIIAGVDKDGIAYRPAVICEHEDLMFKSYILLDELKAHVKERCLDSLVPIEVDE
jgi:hypothetical protein